MGEELDLKDLVTQALQELYNSFNGKIFNKISSVSEHPLLRETFYQVDNPVEEKVNCEQIFASYIREFFNQTNKQYFLFLVKFVSLFRECINHYRHSSDPNFEFTQINSADGVPDLCNEFITEFMENNDNFGLDTTEVIEIIQHFCNWLYENKFTTSRLTLLS